jgi:hypothetical protein
MLSIGCWNTEPDNRPTINQVVDKLKAIRENIKDIQPSENHKPNLDDEISESNNTSCKDLSQVKIIKETEISMTLNCQFEITFAIIINDIINILNDDNHKIGKQEVLNYLNNQNKTLQEIIIYY